MNAASGYGTDYVLTENRMLRLVAVGHSVIALAVSVAFILA